MIVSRDQSSFILLKNKCCMTAYRQHRNSRKVTVTTFSYVQVSLEIPEELSTMFFTL